MEKIGKDKTKQEVKCAQDLDEKASSVTVSPADATLKEPLQAPSCVQEEKEEKLSGAILKIAIEDEKIQKELEEKLRKTNTSFTFWRRNLRSEKRRLTIAVSMQMPLINSTLTVLRKCPS
ncbi:hypothetical protein V8G54_001337 [Vigna mungo]|uniref:Uncharacterized protein n=1 Tax=Vigna mungo TaxID=3915 RepID=A0AAQ3PA99_VIGMU